jgi:hypothetical protein
MTTSLMADIPQKIVLYILKRKFFKSHFPPLHLRLPYIRKITVVFLRQGQQVQSRPVEKCPH